MANNSVVIDLLLQDAKFKLSIEQATDKAKDLRKEIDKTSSPVAGLRKGFEGLKGGLSSVVDSVFSLKGALVAAAGVFSFKQIIDSAIEAEASVTAAANSLRLSGEYSADALADVEAFAGKLFELKGVGDDTALKMFSLAQSFGLSKDQAKEVVSVAADLSKATGQDLQTSVNNLSAAYNGQVGKLAKLNPALKELTDAQLKAGLATQILGAQFEGSAAAQLNTFGGAVSFTQERFGDLLEEMGFLVTKNEAVIGIVKLAGEAFKTLGGFIAGNKDGIKKLITDAIKGLLTVLSSVVKSVEILGKSFQGLGDINIGDFFKDIAMIIGAVTDEILLLARGFTEIKLLLKNPIAVFKADTLDDLKKANPELATMVNTIQEIEKRREALTEGIARTTGIIPKMADTTEKSFSSAIDDLIDKIGEVPKAFEDAFAGPKPVKIDLEAINGTVKGNGAEFGPDKSLKRDDFGPGGVTFDERVSAFADNFLSSMLDVTEKIGGSLFANILGGKEGARKFIGAAAGAVTEAFLPGMGAAVGPFVEALSQGKEVVKKQVEEFAEALPELIDALVEAIPVFIQTLADKSDEIIIALAKGAPKITAAIATELANPQLYLGVARELGRAAYEGVQYQFQQAAQAITLAGIDLSAAFKKARDDFANFFKVELPEAFREAVSALGGVFNNIGHDIGNAFKESILTAATEFIDKLKEEIKDALPDFKGGGGVTGGGGRKGPSTAERVLNPASNIPGNPNLGDAKTVLGGGGLGLTGDVSSDDSLVLTMLGKVVELLKQPVNVTTTAKIDGRAFADIILTLDRTKQRLA
jgi:hypothetical protein